MSHASIQMPYPLYGKLMTGSEAEAAALVDSYLARADTPSRLEQLTHGEVDLFDFAPLR